MVSTTETIGTTNVTILPERNGRRAWVYLRNVSTGAQNITINVDGEPAVDKEGIYLKQSNSEYTTLNDSSFSDNPVYQGAINAISDAASGTLIVVEKLRPGVV